MAIRRLSATTISKDSVSADLSQSPIDIDNVVQYDTSNVHINGAGFNSSMKVLLTPVSLANTDVVFRGNVRDSFASSSGGLLEANILFQNLTKIIFDVETWFCGNTYVVDVVDTKTGFTQRAVGSNVIIGY